MKTLNHIVAATDLSAPARHAVERAALVAAGLQARLSLVHVASQEPLERLRQLLGASDPAIGEEVLTHLRESMQSLAESVEQRYGVVPSSLVKAGELLPSLLSQAETLAADLLVMGARGNSFLRHILLGATAERLLSSARCPVLVVRQPPHEVYRRVLVPVDFSPVSLRTLRLAAALAPAAELVAMHAFEVPFEGHLRYAGVDEGKIEHYRALAHADARGRLARLVERAELDDRPIRSLVVQGDVSQRILEEEQESDCDLIVVGKHGEGMFEELLLGSTTKHILAESQGDVLVAN